MEFCNHPSYSIPSNPLLGVPPGSNPSLQSMEVPTNFQHQPPPPSVLGVPNNTNMNADSDPSNLRSTMFEQVTSSSTAGQSPLLINNDPNDHTPTAMDMTAVAQELSTAVVAK